MEQNEESKNEVTTPEVPDVQNEVVNLDAPSKKKKKTPGKAMNIIAILCLVYGLLVGLFSLICLSSYLIPVFYYIALILIVVVTLGIIFAEYPNFGDYFSGDSVIIQKITPALLYMAPFMIGLSGILYILSIILFSCNKKRRKKAGIIVSSVFFALYVIAVVISFVIQILLRMQA